jgi:hypothetical protein
MLLQGNDIWGDPFLGHPGAQSAGTRFPIWAYHFVRFTVYHLIKTTSIDRKD